MVITEARDTIVIVPVSNGLERQMPYQSPPTRGTRLVFIPTVMSSNASGLTDRSAQRRLLWLATLDSGFPPEGHIPSNPTAQELDDELQLVDEIALLAKRRRNAHVAWPCKLPFEVLAMILAEIKQVWNTHMTRLTKVEERRQEFGPEWRKSDCTHYRDLGWLNATFVCHRLRKVMP